MSIFKNVKKEIKKNKQVRLDGGYTCIPFVLMPKLGKIVPGVEQEKYYLVTANSKVGKTKLADFLFVYNPYEFATKYKSDIKVKIFYFSLEVSKEEKVSQYYSYRLYKDHNIIISPEKLKSRFESYILEDEIEKLIDSYDEEMEKFESMVEFIDNVKNPYGIYKHVRNHAFKNGTHYDINGKAIPLSELMSDDTKVRDRANLSIHRYEPHDPNEYVIVVVDHLSLLHPERGADLWSTIFSFSDIDRLGDNYREFLVMLNRSGSGFTNIDLYFNGAVNFFKELPLPTEIKEEHYKGIEETNKKAR